VKIALISLGCPKNLVDSERILALLGERNHTLVADPREADAVIVNTCAFLGAAVDEAREHIAELTRMKSVRPRLKILVTGCLAQRTPELLRDDGAIDGVIGAGDPMRVAEALEEMAAGARPVEVRPETFLTARPAPRLVLTSPYAYLKVSEGCDNRCHYCLIPQLRGQLRSVPVRALVREAGQLAGLGVRELVLVAQDTTAYGVDLKDGTSLPKLLKQLVKLDIPRLRILYAYPSRVTDDLLSVMAGERKICRYLDIPLQHAHPEILGKMKRPVIDYEKLVRKLRRAVPELHLRTTFMVGFPGEEERHFQYLRDFIKEMRFERLGVFSYSREAGTPAYYFPGQVPEEVKEERRRILMMSQECISKEIQGAKKGRIYPVLIERKEKGRYAGRTEFDAPEIDGSVYVTGRGLKPGEFRDVRIIRADAHDLYGSA